MVDITIKRLVVNIIKFFSFFLGSNILYIKFFNVGEILISRIIRRIYYGREEYIYLIIYLYGFLNKFIL